MAASTPRNHGSRLAVLATDDEGDYAGVRGVATVDVSIFLLPECVPRIDADPASSFLRGTGSQSVSSGTLNSTIPYHSAPQTL